MGSEGKVIKHLLVDLDGTLYRSAKLFSDVRDNIEEYLTTHLSVKAEDAREEGNRLYREYGLTIAGLLSENFKVDAKHWHSHVHGNLKYSELLPKSSDLRELLDSLPMPKYIFTNADKIHAEVCLDQIGIKECFEDIISFDCILDTIRPGPDGYAKEEIFCKPDLRAFEFALKRADAKAETTMFLDDSAANIKGAKAAGLQTVLVGNKNLCEGADHAIEDFLELKDAAPYLWN